ncbi:MAG: hypothetical protein NT007_00270 [Candidatus Kapabacteria bacterium]|nr:hypothetical protein [Candidatus Kapabacteria bacterium]
MKHILVILLFLQCPSFMSANSKIVKIFGDSSHIARKIGISDSLFVTAENNYIPNGNLIDIYDMRNIESPNLIGENIEIDGYVLDILGYNQYVFVGTSNSLYRLEKTIDSYKMTKILSQSFSCFILDANYIYCKNTSNDSLTSIDISNPQKPYRVTEVYLGKVTIPANNAFKSSNYVYFIGVKWIFLMSLTGPWSASYLYTYSLPWQEYELFSYDSYLYVCTFSKIYIYNVKIKSDIVLIDSIPNYFGQKVFCKGDTLYMLNAHLNALTMLDMSNRLNPTLIDNYYDSGVMFDMKFKNNYVYMGNEFGFSIYQYKEFLFSNDTVSITSPPKDTSYICPPLKISWDDKKNYNNYKLHFESFDFNGNSNNFDTIVKDKSFILEQLPIGAIFNWNISILISNVNTNSTSNRTFITAYPPFQTKLIFPMNNFKNASKDILFKWNSSQFSNSYQICISDSSTSKIYNSIDTFCTIPDLKPGRNYKWTTRGSNCLTQGQFWSDTLSFTTSNLPKAVILTAPADSANNQNTQNLYLQWNNSTEAEYYKILISKQNNFLDSSKYLSYYSTNASFMVDNLDYNTKYYWQVNAVNSWGEVPSEIYSFNTLNPFSVDLQINNKDSFDIDINTSGQVFAKALTYNSELANFRLYDLLGSQVCNLSIELKSGLNIIPIKQELAKGVYFGIFINNNNNNNKLFKVMIME